MILPYRKWLHKDSVLAALKTEGDCAGADLKLQTLSMENAVSASDSAGTGEVQVPQPSRQMNLLQETGKRC